MTVLELSKLMRNVPSDWEVMSHAKKFWFAPSGLPVVAYGVGGIPEVVRHNWNGLLYQPGDFYNLAINLIHLIHSPDERKRMSENARKSIGKEFDINYMVKQLEDLYESHNNGRRQEG